jgi:hypothetical protein
MLSFRTPISILGIESGFERFEVQKTLQRHYVYPCQGFSTGNTLEDYNP